MLTRQLSEGDRLRFNCSSKPMLHPAMYCYISLSAYNNERAITAKLEPRVASLRLPRSLRHDVCLVDSERDVSNQTLLQYTIKRVDIESRLMAILV